MRLNRIIKQFFSRYVAKIVNYAGAKVYTLMPEMELYSAVATTMLNDSYYEKTAVRLDRIKVLVGQANPVFVAKLAINVQEQLYLRSAPVVLLSELAKIHNGDDWLKIRKDSRVRAPV